MKAVRVYQYGGLEELKYEDVTIPESGEGEVRVKVEAVGVNFIDENLVNRISGSE